MHVVSEYTGRGPARARTTTDGETVVVIVQDSMTKAERSLARFANHIEPDAAAEIFLLGRKAGVV